MPLKVDILVKFANFQVHQSLKICHLIFALIMLYLIQQNYIIRGYNLIYAYLLIIK